MDFHPFCAKKIFGKTEVPMVPYSQDQMYALAEEVVKSQLAVTGVQPKLSLDLEKLSRSNSPPRFTIVGLWGSYILKPPTEKYPNLPELEDVTMHLAEICNIPTVPHSLIRLQDGTLAYITKRIDRHGNKKIHMEDMCQLTQKQTEHKYRGSHEQVAKVLAMYSANPILDVISFFEQVVFCFLTGNADMHLKNFSLIKQDNEYVLSPAYDMVASALVVEGDDEDLALTLNGKKKKITRRDFIKVFELYEIELKAQQNIFEKFNKYYGDWMHLLEESFLPDKLKDEYKKLIKDRAKRIGLST
jgi:serine/threonine-protein kinase HipA